MEASDSYFTIGIYIEGLFSTANRTIAKTAAETTKFNDIDSDDEYNFKKFDED